MSLLPCFVILAFFTFVSHVAAGAPNDAELESQNLTGWRLPSTILLSGSFYGEQALRRIVPDLKVRVLHVLGSDEANDEGIDDEADSNPPKSMRSIVTILGQLESGRIELRGKNVVVTGVAPRSIIPRLISSLKEEFREYDIHSEITPSTTAPQEWAAYRLGNSIELSGYVKGDLERSRLVSMALHLFKGAVVTDKMRTGGFLSGQFEKLAETLLAQLNSVDTGLVRIFNDKFDVVGEYIKNTGDRTFEHDNVSLCRSFLKLVPEGYKCGLIDVSRRMISHFGYHKEIRDRPFFTPTTTENLKIEPTGKVLDRNVVDIFFATTRHPEKDKSKPSMAGFSGERDKLSFGQARVRVPENHNVGHIELPGAFSIFGITLYKEKEDEKKHFILRSVERLTLQKWNSLIDQTGANEALLFVHGFNTSFEQSIFRLAQIVADLRYHGLPVLFSWASRGKVVDYLYDRDSALNDRTAFLQLLSNLKNDHKISTIHIIAHSMGNFLVLDALAHLQRSQLSLGELIMAAPDIDRSQFEEDIALIKPYFRGLTLYASSRDKALMLSKAAAGNILRAGDVSADGPIVLPGLESIDVSVLGNELFGLNHSMFAESRPLMNDIRLLMTEGRRAPRLIEVRPMPQDKPPPKYWQFQ